MTSDTYYLADKIRFLLETWEIEGDAVLDFLPVINQLELDFKFLVDRITLLEKENLKLIKEAKDMKEKWPYS